MPRETRTVNGWPLAHWLPRTCDRLLLQLVNSRHVHQQPVGRRWLGSRARKSPSMAFESGGYVNHPIEVGGDVKTVLLRGWEKWASLKIPASSW